MGDGTGWPVLQPVDRGWTWLVRISVAFIAAGCVLRVVDLVIDVGQRPAWRWALIAAGGLVALTGSVRVWMLAGRVRRIVPDPARSRATSRQYRAARAALRTGAVLTDHQRRLVAVEVAQLEMAGGITVLLTAQLGVQVMNWLAPETLILSGTVVLGLAFCALQLVAIGGLAALQAPVRRLREPAARIGAVALDPDAAPHDSDGRGSR